MNEYISYLDNNEISVVINHVDWDSILDLELERKERERCAAVKVAILTNREAFYMYRCTALTGEKAIDALCCKHV